MTVSTTSNKVSFSANGSTTAFAYNFKIFADADLTVIIRAADGTETTKTLTTHYTVSGAGSASGGNVTFTSGNTPANGETVVIARQLTKTQGTDYVANDPFPAESDEDALDRLTFITQELQEEIDRSIKASVTNTISGAEFTVSATDRANKVFAFDSSGDLSVTQELGTFRGNWAASTAYAVRDLVKDTSTNNIFIVNTAHTSSGAQPLTSNANSAKYDLIVDAATATSAQTAAASSASSASTSAATATTKASEAATSAAASAASATAAAASETASAASETASAASETASAASETASAASQTAAAASASSASTSAATATTKASEASTSASTATTKASEAASSQTAAASSASSASTSAGTATTKAGEASTSATNAASSATAAASSATAAAASQTAAAASAASAASAFDNFDDTYLGSKTSNPTVDNDGDALVAGALYFNSTANEMRVYDGANWIAATSAGNVSLILYEYTATAGQTTFSGSDDNSATLSYTVDNLQVVMNGIVLDPSDFTATNGTSVVLASGAALNDLVNIYAFKSFTTADMVSKTNGGTFAGAVTVPQLNADNIRIDGNTISSTNANGNLTLDPNGTGDISIASGQINFGAVSNNTESVHLRKSGNSVAGLGVNAQYGVRVAGPSDSSAPVSIGNISASDGTTFTESMRIDSSGKVGIGTTPDRDLHVKGASGEPVHFKLEGDPADYARIMFDDGTTDNIGELRYNFGSDYMSFNTNSAERMRIESGGNVYIGGTGAVIDSSSKLGVHGRIDASATSTTPMGLNRSGSDGVIIDFGNDGTFGIGHVSVSGSSVAYATSSDHRLKENVVDMTGAIARVKQLAPKRFNFISNTTDTLVDGFLAHEAQTVVPEAVTGTHNEVDDDGNAVMQGIDQSKLVPLLTGALQEAIAKIETLETKVAALEGGQ